ncbi:MAG: nitroreductase family deazaflavin-dependent oxidoreductase [Anaerolineales bacterium]|jgi:deazaflavin-dependent oxidoreductase (nitroreductase family)|nr:nitroreductase family deazaflavin-dependent oxidoreductase [Anaerolineales bacterium]
MDKKPNALQKLIHRFLMLRPVTAILARILHHADRALFKISGGRHSAAEIVGLPIIQLTTIGAKSGQPRAIPLVGLFDGERIALIGSNFGQKRNPGWYYNLVANPNCEVVKGGRARRFTAREVFGDERETYWQMALSYYDGYKKYKERASHRHIPVMLLEPDK